MKKSLFLLIFSLLFMSYTISVTYTVTDFGDGVGATDTLRDAITSVNSGAGGGDIIEFSNSSTDTIQLVQGVLPTITQKVTINGTNLATGNNVTIDGSGLILTGDAWGLRFNTASASESEVRNLTVTNFVTDGNVSGILMYGVSTNKVTDTIVDNVTIGDLTSTGDSCVGIEVQDRNQVTNNKLIGTITGISDGSSGIEIGGENNQVSGNIISGTITGSGGSSIGIFSEGENNQVSGNIISGSIGSELINNSAGITASGINEVSDNTVSASIQAATLVGAIATSSNDVQILSNNITLDFVQNAVVTSPTGTKAGVLIIGNGATPPPVPSTEGINNLISQNSIYGNLDVPGISLVNQGNFNQAAPVIDSVTICGQNVTAEGSLFTRLGSDYTVEFFSNDQRSQPNQGIHYIGSITVNGVAGGTVQFNQQFTSTHTFTGNEYITATATDANNNTSEFSLPFISSNNNPIADSSTFSVCSGETFNGQLTGSNIGTNPVFNLSGSGPTKGVLVLNTDGSFSYTANPGASGADSFEFTITNNGCTSDPATVTIDINITPTADSLTFSVCSGETFNGQLTGSNIGTNPIFNLSGSGPTKGTLVLNPDGTFGYTANQGTSGADSFEFTITNNGCTSDPATTSITISECNGDTESISIGIRELSGNRVIVFGTEEGLDNRDVSLYQNGELIQTVHINSPFSFIVGPLQPGEYVYQVKAFDNDGNEISSNIVDVVITTPIPPIPPIPPRPDFISPIAKAIRNKYCPLVSPNVASVNSLLQNLT